MIVVTRRSPPPLNVTVAPAAGSPEAVNTNPVTRPAWATKIFDGLGSELESAVAVPERALLAQPLRVTEIGSVLTAGAGIENNPFASEIALPPFTATLTPATGLQSAMFFTLPDIVPMTVPLVAR